MPLLNEYSKSTLVLKLQNLKLAFLDIDNTLTGNIDDVNHARTNLEKLGFGIILVSARTEEMLMGKGQYQLSKNLGFKRPPARLKKEEPNGILDPDIIIGSSGTAILIRQQSGGYLIDKGYQKRINTFKNWRVFTLNLLKEIDPKKQYYYLPEMENPKNYYNGRANILTPKFRIQLNFKSLKDKKYIYKSLQKIEKTYNLNLSDDSDARKDKYSIFLTPKGITKGKAVNQVINKTCETFFIKREKLEILFAGDSLADLDMGFLEIEGPKTTLLIVGGSRLNIGQIKSFTSTIPGIPPNHLIIGDNAYPGTVGPQTILAFTRGLDKHF